jgi:hypothetical protein
MAGKAPKRGSRRGSGIGRAIALRLAWRRCAELMRTSDAPVGKQEARPLDPKPGSTDIYRDRAVEVLGLSAPNDLLYLGFGRGDHGHLSASFMTASCRVRVRDRGPVVDDLSLDLGELSQGIKAVLAT